MDGTGTRLPLSFPATHAAIGSPASSRSSPSTRLHSLAHPNANAAPAVSSCPSLACARRSLPAPPLLAPCAPCFRFCHPVLQNPRSLNSFRKQKHTRKREGSPGAIAQLRRINLGEVAKSQQTDFVLQCFEVAPRSSRRNDLGASFLFAMSTSLHR